MTAGRTCGRVRKVEALLPEYTAAGHNQGPPLYPATSWRLYAWRKAHKAAWKTPPLEVVRLRMKRARAMGLDYRTYASLLLDRGCSPEALVFSLGGTLLATDDGGISINDSGRVAPRPGVFEKLSLLERCRIFIVADELNAAMAIGQLGALCGNVVTAFRICEKARRAEAILSLTHKHKISPSACVMIGEDEPERQAAQAAGLGCFIPAAAYFS